MRIDLYARMRNDVVQAAERCGIDTKGKTTDVVAQEMSARIVNLEAELQDAKIQLAALTRTVLQLRELVKKAGRAGE